MNRQHRCYSISNNTSGGTPPAEFADLGLAEVFARCIKGVPVPGDRVTLCGIDLVAKEAEGKAISKAGLVVHQTVPAHPPAHPPGEPDCRDRLYGERNAFGLRRSRHPTNAGDRLKVDYLLA